jgi:phytoene dehydrogenase-like protein
MSKIADVIIVGGGLGGLTAGALLSKRGKKVTLIEQHNVVGGYATTFKRKDFKVEVGLHELDGLHESDTKMKIFKELDVFNNIEFVKVPQFYTFRKGNLNIEISDNIEKTKATLLTNFPNEKKGINQFFKIILAIGDEVSKMPDPNNKIKLIFSLPTLPFRFPNLVFKSKKTVGEFLDSITRNEDLKMVLTANLGYYHDNPYELSLLYFGVAQSSYFQGGGHFIKGGSQNLSNYLRDVILQNSGKVILKNLVTDILIEDGKAVGVKYQKTKGGEIQNIFSENIIFNGAIPNLVDMLPKAEKELISTKIKKLKLSPSILTLYLGFNKPLKDLGNKFYTTMFFSENAKFGEATKENWNICDYSQIDSGLTDSDKSLAVIVEMDYAINWNNLSNEQYKIAKEKKIDELLSKLENEIPNIKKHIIYSELATAKTNKRYTLNPDGAVYGFAQFPNQAFLNRIQNRSAIKNLFFASAWTMPGGGFTGAILSGYFASLEIK